MPAIRREQITGLVLAGGRGSRMGGVDKGLQPFHGVPLALHAVRRLAPQVGCVIVNANRHLDRYAAFGVPVCRDAVPAGADEPAYAGPLAGMLAALRQCTTPLLATVPCDSPRFPPDLVERLAAALAGSAADLAMAATPAAEPNAGTTALRPEPVFCLLRIGLADSLRRFLHDGGRQVARWAALHHRVDVPFDDRAAFANANTRDELAGLQLPLPAVGSA